ncbi:MIP/aquaporin family protein [Streptomyces cadmiisoli]|uniref:MIP/aquaporin family protein n=1 Tax=Streptomyces cadmiisoli TaxID=2184053 RepID=UPI001FE6B238|nr:aquaporin [Streptomyces cadmiisoli]
MPVPVRGNLLSTSPAVLRHSAVELVLTFLLLLSVTTVVRWVIGSPAVSSAIPEVRLQLLAVGAIVGILITGLVLSPLGRQSGAHMNPAISFAMWRLGLLPGAAVVPYTVAQLSGSLLGVFAARGIWGRSTSAPPVTYAALQPGPGWSAAELFAAETLSTGVIVLLVAVFTSVRRLTRHTPYMVGTVVCLTITLLGNSTGGSTNPARQFGPALASGQYSFLWVYLLAPVPGAALGVLARNLLLKRTARTPAAGVPT